MIVDPSGISVLGVNVNLYYALTKPDSLKGITVTIFSKSLGSGSANDEC